MTRGSDIDDLPPSRPEGSGPLDDPADGTGIAPVLGMRAMLRYPIEVGDVSERPKVQHSKCCLVKANVGSNPTVTADEEGSDSLITEGIRAFFFAWNGSAITRQ